MGSILGPPSGRDFGRVSCVTNIIENQREPQRESGICMFLRNACFVHFSFACSSIAVLSDIGRYACCDATADVGAVCLSAHASCPRCPPLYARAVTPTLHGLKPAGYFLKLTGPSDAVIRNLGAAVGAPKLLQLDAATRDFRIRGSEFGLVFEPGKWALFWAPSMRYAWFTFMRWFNNA